MKRSNPTLSTYTVSDGTLKKVLHSVLFLFIKVQLSIQLEPFLILSYCGSVTALCVVEWSGDVSYFSKTENHCGIK